MTVSDYYLTCFIVGFGLSALSFLLGVVNFHIHLPFHLHLPGFGDGVGHVPHVHVGHAGHVHASGGGHGHAQGGCGSELPYINFGTVTAFLAWFGGMGYLLTRHTHLVFWSALFLSGVAGLVGSTAVFVLVNNLLVKHEHELDPYENHPLGALGRVVSSIREGGTGEIIFVQGERRMTSGARAEDGSAISKGTEVVVTKYEKGIAYVRTWEEVNAEIDASPNAHSLRG
jgi:membrane protein implicated in regulation of membrane protease activity